MVLQLTTSTGKVSHHADLAQPKACPTQSQPMQAAYDFLLHMLYCIVALH